MKFSFGENWLSFSQRALNAERVAEARHAFQSLTRDVDLKGARFLDIGFGQGLALFLASEAGANAYGIDIDPLNSEALKATGRFFPGLPVPKFETASIIDDAFVRAQEKQGGFDVVHSWGVLHHTGDMARAIRNAAVLVKPGGFLFISIYNRHWTSPLWSIVKRVFNHVPRFAQEMAVRALYPFFWLRAQTFRQNSSSSANRGMDLRHDIRDWLGGYPYEYASITEIEKSCADLGLTMIRCNRTQGFTGCNEFVLRKRPETSTVISTD